MEDFSALFFDEVHCGMDNHALKNLAKTFNESKQPILAYGITSIPSNMDEIMKNYCLKAISFPSKTCKEMHEQLNFTQVKFVLAKTSKEQELLRDVLCQRLQELNQLLGILEDKECLSYQNVYILTSLLRKEFHLAPERVEIIRKMMKLIYLIEMSEILGTKYVLDYMKDDLDERLFDRSRLTMKSSYSQRLGILLKCLKEMNDEGQAIIFVKTRDMAERLTKSLQRTKELGKFFTKRIIGQNGVSGMKWDVEQKLLIEEFKRIECRVVVATGVIGEGLDISSCDKVFLFSSDISLRRILQTRGRVGKKEVQFTVIVESKNEDFSKETKEQDLKLENQILKV